MKPETEVLKLNCNYRLCHRCRKRKWNENVWDYNFKWITSMQLSEASTSELVSVSAWKTNHPTFVTADFFTCTALPKDSAVTITWPLHVSCVSKWWLLGTKSRRFNLGIWFISFAYLLTFFGLWNECWILLSVFLLKLNLLCCSAITEFRAQKCTFALW